MSTMVKFFAMLLLNNSLFAYIGGITNFSELPKDLEETYEQLMILYITFPARQCTSIAVAKNQIITAYHCVKSVHEMSDTTNVYKNMYILPHITIIDEENRLFFYSRKLVLNQDFSIHTDVDKDLDPTLFPVFMNPETPADVALVTINKENEVNQLRNIIAKDKIVMTKKAYCDYFTHGCKTLKDGYHLYFFGLRSAKTRRELLPKNSKLYAYIPLWTEVSSNDISVVSNDYFMPYIRLKVTRLESELGDSGGPVFICNYNIIMRDENECKMIAVQSTKMGTSSFFVPVFLLNKLDEQNIKQNKPNFLSITNCDQLISDYKDDAYVYFNLGTKYFRFNISSDKMADYNLIATIAGLTNNTGFKFTKCEDGKLYFSNDGGVNQIFELQQYNFYKDYTKSLTNNKFDNCKDFNEYYSKKQDELLFYASFNKIDPSIFLMQFFKFEKISGKLNIYNRESMRYEKMKYDIVYLGCENDSNKEAFIKFGSSNAQLFFALHEILFY